MNKKGFLRIVEASISILIIAGVLFVFFNQQKAETQEGEDIAEIGRDILEELSKNAAYRNRVLLTPSGESLPAEVENFIDARVPNYLTYEARVCDVDEACGQSEYVGQVFSAERSISSTLDYLGPKKIRLFIWQDFEGE